MILVTHEACDFPYDDKEYWGHNRKGNLMQTDIEISDEKIDDKMLKTINSILPDYVVGLCAYGDDLRIILDTFEGIPRLKVNNGKPFVWYGEIAKIIYMNMVWRPM